MEKWKQLQLLWQPFRPKSVSICASAAGFYLLLSLLPALILLSSLLRVVPVDPMQILHVILQGVPSTFHNIFFQIAAVHTSPTFAAVSASAFTLLWSASKGVQALMDGINAVLNNPHQHGFLKRRLIAMGYFLLILPVLLCYPVFICFGRLFPSGILIGSIGLALIFTMIYRLFPSEPIGFLYCFCGAAAAALGWMLFSRLFSIYVNHISGVNTLYGSVGLLISLLLWLQISLSILLYGCILSQLLQAGTYHPFRILRTFFRRTT